MSFNKVIKCDLEDNASGVQVGDIEQVIVLNMFKIR